jgi:aldehyde:ferredoxin oxidoreductase
MTAGIRLPPSLNALYTKEGTLPKTFFDEPLGKDGKTIRREDLRKMLQDYYALRGWNSEGIPKP